jgi:REP element-mobilizing transposase RayT
VDAFYGVSMARKLRLEVAGGTYHVTARGNNGCAIFLDDGDRRRLLSILGVVVALMGWQCHAYCLMDTHYHLVITTPEPNLARGMQRFNGIYAASFNRRHVRTGHLFQGRYYSVLVEEEQHALELCRYLALNPKRAGMCARAEDWPWSSFGPMLGLCAGPAFLSPQWILDQFGDDPATSIARFHAFVSEEQGL